MTNQGNYANQLQMPEYGWPDFFTRKGFKMLQALMKHCVVGCLLLMFGFSATTTTAQTGIEDYNFSSCSMSEDQPRLLGGARPASRILESVDMLSQPPLSTYTDPLTIATLPQNIWVIVFDLDDQTGDWFRILVPCEDFAISGWIPATSVRYNTRRANLYAAPPGCAIPLGVVDSLDELWESPVSGTIAVAFDVFRNTSGTRYPDSFFYPTRNGRELRDKERRIATSGAFLLSGSVISTEVQPGQMIGFSVISSSDEQLRMYGIMYEVPDGCQFAER